MQWRRQKKVTHVIGSSNHVLLLARYQDAPPGEEDEEEGLRKDYVKSQEKETNAHTHFDRNGQQGGYKPRRAGTSISGGSTSGYASSGSRSHRDESAGSPSQPKIIFNEEEYTRITTPRQDVLFKKGYLSRKKLWTGNASTSATPSTTESQSASHSTADGSETTEDQQLLDSGTGEYPPMSAEPGAQLGYGTFYDHASGYYYEYPVMLVGPAPVPAQVGPNVLATVPCGPVPLRPIEWINPAFVPKLANQPYCLMDYQTNQSTEPIAIVEEQNGTIVAAEASNSMWNESGTGSASCSGSVAEEIEEQVEEAENATMEQHIVKEQLIEEQPQEQLHLEGQQHLENGMTMVDPYLDPLMMQEPTHMSHMVPAVPQPYIYPGHYMFGPPLVNVNGVTIQGGPLVRTMDVTAMTMAYAKRRKKKKKRKQRRPTLGNTEDEEEGEYSSECDNDVSSSRLPWSECPTLTAITTTSAANRPLNPECQEFQLRPALQSRILSAPVLTSTVTTVAEEVTSPVNDAPDMSSYTETESASREIETCDSSTAQSLPNQEEATIHNSEQIVRETSLDNIQSPTIGHMPRDRNAEINSQANNLVANVEAIITNGTIEIRSNAPTDYETPSRTDTSLENDGDSTSANTKHESFENNSNDINTNTLNNHVRCPEENLANGDTNHEHFADLMEKVSESRSMSPQENDSNLTTINVNEKEEVQRLRYCNNSSITRATSLGLPRKYNKKGLKFVRESTPGPDLDEHLDVESKILVQQFEAVELSDADCKCNIVNDKLGETERKVANEGDALEVHNESTIKTTNRDTIQGSNEDSGFESQSRLSKKYPITAAVKEWLRRANSPDLFITSASTSESETDEDDEEMDATPPKNLQGNPMPALSANSGVDNVTLLSRTASCGEFAKTNNNNINNNNARNDQMEADSTSIGRRKRDAKVVKRKTMAKRNDKRNKNVDEKTQSQLVSSLVSLNFVTAVRPKDKPKNNVGDVCEFTQEDSVAGMRVALSSRINSKRVNGRRMKTLRKISKNPVENIDIKMRRIDNLNDGKGKETIEDSMVSVRTFEKGEIIVSQDGRLLPMSSYEPVPFNFHGNPIAKTTAYVDVINKNVEICEKISKNSSENDENDSVMIGSSVSIEEPDVLECWEETVEPVITPKRMLQSPGVLCEGEAAEDDNIEIEKAIVEHVQRYYRLARDTVNTEEESSEFSTSVISSRTVPNDSEDKTIGYFCGEEIPIYIPDKNQDVIIADEKIPIDEAFEVYESCYNGKSPFLSFDSKMFGQRSLYGQNGDGPIPCRAVCCNIQ
ncbi:PREDICTED: uncharacterized protein LOC108751181 isoform X1 [Trachymyrmex septentrionalis]|uniref:uncharacterized protein LOC108751181 isoform X1 n=1 Tax=Trachymyrmex septentrionalis TaxID=34720 RepID=UPI00084F1FEF|nr:PREDICTED: uncharacterized protein LOC108751181 isoform X1 [Trachymyrmex septentrionalis]